MKSLFFLLILPLLSACANSSGVTSYLSPYRIDIRQGNMVTQEMVAQLKPGLSKEQVRFILGTPLVADMFHADRWDYVYRFRPGRDHDAVERRHLVVYFANGKLMRVGGDVVAGDLPAASETPGKAANRVIDIAPGADVPK